MPDAKAQQAIVLLRGINLGPANRIAMPALRGALADAGFADARTHLQSGNVVVGYAASQARLAAEVHDLIRERFGLEIGVVVRSAAELEDAIARNPFVREAQAEPRQLQVTFMDAAPDPERVSAIAALAAEGELLELSGRELYTWHPNGIGRSKLAAALVRVAAPGAVATSRNWRTVLALSELARGGG